MVNFLLKADEIIAGALSNKFPNSIETNILFRYFSKDGLDSFFKIITKLGEGYFEIIIIFILIYMYKQSNNKNKIYLFWIKGIIYNFMTSGIVVSILKRSIGRARPYVDFNPNQFYGFRYLLENNLVSNSSYHSFPSGHTITVFSTIWFLYLNMESKKLKFILIGIGILVGISRIYLSYHWFTDVVSSMIVSYIIAKFINSKIKERKEIKIHKLLPYKC